MSPESEVITINKQALIQAAIALERQETFHTALLLNCLDQIDAMNRKVQRLLANAQADQARGAMLEVCKINGELDTLLTDDLLEEWEAEAKLEASIPEEFPQYGPYRLWHPVCPELEG